jgi:hypothetical protein
MHSQQSYSAPEGGWLPGARSASAASRSLSSDKGPFSRRRARISSPVELRLNASSDCAARERAIVSERKRGLRASERCSEPRRVARTCAINARHKRASGILRRTRRLVTCHALSWRGAYLPTHVRDGCAAGRGLISWATNTHLSPKVRDRCRHSVSCIFSSRQIERTMMKCHDLRGNEAAVAGLPSGFAPLYVQARVGLLKRIGGRRGRFGIKSEKCTLSTSRPLCPSGSRGQT